MLSYTEAATKITDNYVAGVERVTEAVPTLSESVRSAVDAAPAFAKPILPQPVVVPGVPTLSEIVTANYRVAERVLDAHRSFALAVVDAFTPRAAESSSN